MFKMNVIQPRLVYIVWEIDTTGRYLIDEICHMNAIDQDRSFNDYIMPHNNISYAASRKIQLYTLSVGMYRYLRRTESGMIMKTYSEIVTLKRFLNWLNKCGNTKVVLMCYEQHEHCSYILLQALKRYGLLENFKSIVYGFADVYGFIRKKCKRSVSSFSLRTLAKILLNRSNIRCLDSQCRANLVNKILLHLCEDSNNPEHNISQEMFYFVSTVDEVEERLYIRLIKRSIQWSLGPIFVPYFKKFKSRRRALFLRNILVYKSSIDYGTLRNMWSKGPEEFKNEMKALICAPKKDVTDLITIISLHFNNCVDIELLSEVRKLQLN